ncbi:hypothetical protein BU204_07590 [Actinophytocola xanthii]|uniref:HTH cro/C1-type domain-containing protein n=1 Tax=Actinophytocola xanthii TaxID=1912961 RepID=A0A1Q8CV05_9PSEU|nr:hypothetical protein BU204_07590 [Actinophytocola xanthii]
MVARRNRRALAGRRKSAGFTQESLAEALGVDRSTVIRWEAGQHEPVPYLWPKFAELLGISRDELAERAAHDRGTHGPVRGSGGNVGRHEAPHADEVGGGHDGGGRARCGGRHHRRSRRCPAAARLGRPVARPGPTPRR